MLRAGGPTLTELTVASLRAAPRFLVALAPFLLVFTLADTVLGRAEFSVSGAESLLSFALSSVFHLVVVGVALRIWRNDVPLFSAPFSLCQPVVIWRVLLFNLRLLVCTAIGCALLLVPGVIYLMNRVFALPVLIDRGCSVSEACSISKELMGAGGAWYSPSSTFMRFSLYSSLPFVLVCASTVLSILAAPPDLSLIKAIVGEELMPISAVTLISSVASDWRRYLCAVASSGVTAVAELMIVGFYWDIDRRIVKRSGRLR